MNMIFFEHILPKLTLLKIFVKRHFMLLETIFSAVPNKIWKIPLIRRNGFKALGSERAAFTHVLKAFFISMIAPENS